MPLFEVSTVSLFRHKYVIEAKNLEHAYDTVLIDKPEYVTQKYLDENIIDGRQIGKIEFEDLCSSSMKDDSELSNGHMGTKIIHRVNYNES
jgi:hypothetical protein